MVDNLTFDVDKGMITGFLGPNGAGKSTTMRMMVGLDKPTEGSVTIDGEDYRSFKKPLKKVGTLLDASAVHPKRSAYHHLEAICLANGLPVSSVHHCLSMVGLDMVADKKVGEFSLGMRQRVGLAASLLGDPEYLILDEPVNGLDPEGIRWVREEFLLPLAREGRGIFVSSHQLGELSKMSQGLVVIGKGRLISNETTDSFISSNTASSVIVETSDDKAFQQVLLENNIQAVDGERSGLVIANGDNKTIGDLAFTHGIAVYKLSVESGLEDAFISATSASAQHRSRGRAAFPNSEERG